MTLSEISKLEQAISALEENRPLLGDAVVDSALTPLRERAVMLRSAGDMEQHRKIATVLFADLPGLAAFTERVDAEDLRDTVNALWERLDAVILAHGGRIDKHMGAGVMALWGAETVEEDDPEQAIHAALAMKVACNEFCSSTPLLAGEALSLRVGINTGAVIVGRVGTTAELTALGDTVNLAARLNQAATPDQIMITYDTYRLVRGIFDIELLPPLQVKGKSELVQCYLIQCAKPRAFYILSRGVEGVETHLVGRENELNSLQQAYLDLFSRRQPQIVTITGEMGLGKSRLLAEFLTWTDPRSEDYFLFQARSAPSQITSPYAFLRELFLFRFQIQDSDPLITVIAKMERGFAQMMPGDPNSREKAHIVGQLIGFNFAESPFLPALLADPHQMRSLGFVSLTRFFAAAASVYPVILLLDDIHWADSASLDALRYVFNNLPAQTPLLAVCITRPELDERLPDWRDSLKRAAHVYLRPLSREQSRALVQEILQKVQALPSALRELIVVGAEGNPFYLEELVKMLIDGRVIQPNADIWSVDLRRLDALSIPPTLAGVLQARLDTLDGQERVSLQRASVIGRVFWQQALEVLTPVPENESQSLNISLAALRAKELIFPNPISTFSGTQEFAFKHAILRDVTYETVLKRQRAQYHALIAEWLQQASGQRRSEYLSVIADHYEKAGENDRASLALREAGEQALSVSAFSEAFRLFQRALSLLAPERRRDVIFVQLKISEVFFRSGEYADALKYSEQALQAARELSVGDLLASAMYQVGQIYGEMGDYPAAEALLGEALRLTQAQSGSVVRARLLYGLGNTEWRLGKVESAHQHCSESRDMAAQAGDVYTFLLALNRLGVLAGLMGNPAEEERLYQEVLTRATAAGDRERAAIALNNLGALADEHNDLQKSQQYYRQAMQLAREIGTQQSLALYLLNLGHCLVRMGDLDRACEHLREGLALSDHLGAGPWMLMAVIFFVRLEAARGNTTRALELLGLAEKHPAYSIDHQRLKEQMLAEWHLDDEFILQHMTRGATLEWRATFTQLMLA